MVNSVTWCQTHSHCLSPTCEPSCVEGMSFLLIQSCHCRAEN